MLGEMFEELGQSSILEEIVQVSSEKDGKLQVGKL